MDFLKTFVKYYLFSRWNKVPKEGFELLERHWENMPTGGLKFWLYKKIKNEQESRICSKNTEAICP